jgi:hypothetical protein
MKYEYGLRLPPWLLCTNEYSGIYYLYLISSPFPCVGFICSPNDIVEEDG